jgi:glycosidase
MKTIGSIILLIMATFVNIIAQNVNQANVPAWAKEAIWYQIFPERFNNGDKSNDPKPEDMKGAWPYNVPDGWQIHPWTSDWYKLQPWEVKTGKDFYWNSGVRRYGGDIQGIIDKLDYLKKLGITAIYLTPIFISPSHHKYDASTYHHVDYNFGPNPKKDKEIIAREDPGNPATWQWTTADKLFLKLVSEVHKRGMKIILDGVFNHTGTTFWAFQDIVKNQQNSKYKDWYTITSWDDSITGKKFDYKGWNGVKDLPEVRKEEENGLAAGPREYIHSILKRWMDPDNNGDLSKGIDGWRLDVAEMINHNFWKLFHRWVKGINADAYIVGEIWWDDWKNYKMMNAAPWLQGDEFDAVMNYRFARALKNFVINKKDKSGPQGLIDSLNTLYRQYPKENIYVMMNLLDSHDVERVASMIVNPDIWYDHDGSPSQNKNFDVRKPTDQERLKQRLIVGLQFTLPGAPQIYYGDEVGMWGGDDPDCRKPMVWKELKYETETTHPYGKPRQADGVKFDDKLFNWYQKMASIRKDNKTLSLGDIKFYNLDEAKGILAYKRSSGKESILIIVNNNPGPNELNLQQEITGGEKPFLVNLVNNSKIKKNKDSYKIILEPYQIMILK